jgi:hypothetical protein
MKLENNDGAIPPLLHMSSWHSASLIKHRENFTFYVILMFHWVYFETSNSATTLLIEIW